MAALLHALDLSILTLQTVFLVGAAALGTLCAVEWAVRTRRMHPFSAIARTSRRVLSPLMRPVERGVLRAGGTPNSAPWWTFILAIIAGIVVLQTLDFVRVQLTVATAAAAAGPRGIVHVALRWVFTALYLAILVRVIASWFGAGQFNRLVRWTHTITEPLLGPLRRVLPRVGMIDYSPLVAYLVLRVVESLLFAWM